MKTATIAVGNRRLLKLAAFLEKLPPERFDYRYLVGAGWKGKPDLSCGTTACALGWAAAMPEFRRLGLALRPAPMGVVVRMRAHPKWHSWQAAEHVFAIDYRGFEQLFLPGTDGALQGDATAKQVARHIRKFVAKRSRR